MCLCSQTLRAIAFLFLVAILQYPTLAISQTIPANESWFTIQDGNNATTYSAVRTFISYMRLNIMSMERGQPQPLIDFVAQFGVTPDSSAWNVLIAATSTFRSIKIAGSLTKDDAAMGYDAFMEKQAKLIKDTVLAWRSNYNKLLRDYAQAGGDVPRLKRFIDTWARNQVNIKADKPPSDPWVQRIYQIELLFDANNH